MTTLYFRSGTCALGPHVVLEWIGAPYEAKPVGAGSAELLALNPSGAVPVLVEDDGWVLTQCGAILRYLTRKHPEADLAGGTGIREEAEAEKWSSFLTGDLHPAFYPVFMPYRYTVDEDEAARARVQAAGLALAAKKFAILEAQLGGRDWILGRRSVVDAYALPMIRWGRAKLGADMAAFPQVLALHDRLVADPAVAKVLEIHKAAAKAH